MTAERTRRLRRWHDDQYRQVRDSLPRRLFYLGLELRIPEGVFPPAGSGTFHKLARDEVQSTDRVLDMGTGSGVCAILAAATSSDVVAVDINPKAVQAATENAKRNGVAERITFRQSDVFDAVDGTFDLVIFDPPFRWFPARDMLEMSTADENYRALRRFMTEVKRYLRPGGRILLDFGTSGDIDYVNHLIDRSGLTKEVLSTEEVKIGRLPVTYYTFRLTASLEGR